MVMLDAIQRVAREASRRLRRISCPDSSSTGSPRQTYRARSESSLFDSPDRLSPSTRQRRIIAEHQRQLHREMEEMQDTLTRGFRSRDLLPSCDVSSLASWSSSLGSIGRNKLRRNRMPAWEYVRGPSPMWDTVSSDGSFTKCKSEEMISREDSPKWNVVNNRRAKDDTDFRLPTWDHLEATLNQKLSRFENFEPDSLETNRDVGIDYLMTTNARKEMSQEMRAVEKWSTPVLKQDQDMSLRLSLRKN
ncbi:uncharacterized protein LOC107268810 [Cephus cinctus]|uniref:Uncharacterized protein LOC107268810 n=1 Tax=Cephus cinctus TaxID=211228 RepID=A0AAJ7BYD5_CEPCN|nr:uncharacterized protein LOC107268810 [Cephus cinctus]